MKSKLRSNPFLRPFTLAAIVLTLGTTGTLFLDSAHAATYTWDGGASTSSLNDKPNWSDDTVTFASGDTVTWDATVAGDLALTYSTAFGASVSTDNGLNLNITDGHTGSLQIGIASTNDGGSFQLGNIDIASGAGAFTLGGVATTSRVAFRNLSNTQTFTNNSSNVATFGSNITYFSAAATSRTLAFTGTGDWQVDGPLGVASGSLLVTKSGAGTLTLNGANTYTKGTTISEGTIKLGNASALGAAPGGSNPNAVSVAATGAVLDLNGQTITRTNALTLNGSGISSGGALINSNATAASYAGAVTLGSDSSIGGANGITLSGIIGGGFNLTKVDAGTLTLSRANGYTGTTAVTGGKLTISSAGTINSTNSVSIGAGEFNYNSATALTKGISFSSTGGTLSGTGTITPAVTVSAGNTLAPGSVGGIGTLSTGATTAIAGTYACDLDAAASDGLAVTGALDLTGATLAVNALATPAASIYTIATCTTGITSGFTGLAEGATLTISGVNYTISYAAGGGNQVTLTKATASGFSGWANSNGATGQTVDQDHDTDGVKNGIEYFMGESGSGFTAIRRSTLPTSSSGPWAMLTPVSMAPTTCCRPPAT